MRTGLLQGMDRARTIKSGRSVRGGVSVRRTELSSETAGWLEAASQQPYPALLESSLRDPDQGVYSILCWDPYKIMTMLRDGRVEIADPRGGATRIERGDPFRILSEEFGRERAHTASDFPLPFAGGAVGYFSYDLRHCVENLPVLCSYDLPVPRFSLCFYDRALVFDHRADTAYLVGDGAGFDRMLAQRESVLRDGAHKTFNHPPGGGPRLRSNFTPEGYRDAVRRVLEYIGAGDIFQANLSQRFDATCDEGGVSIYRRLRRINPAPFSAFLRYPGFDIVSSSPERFLLLDGDRVVTRPIKGTRPRREGEPEFNEKMRAELLNSDKDHAELAMIVDLERNDLGRVCSYGSVQVEEHAVLETYPTVYHLVSTVTGRLHRPRCNEFDLLRAAFPGGSITGAPKIRAMEIIEELEPVARNVYTGAIGYISFHGRMDMNILIRTMLLIDGRVYMQFGGGIVADSDPESEYRETIHKGSALFRAIGASNYNELMADAGG